LDDYHCLLFLFGAAQLSKQSVIKPIDIHDKDVLAEHADEYLYLEGIRFIKQIKSSAPFAETSPMVSLSNRFYCTFDAYSPYLS
jgi:serine/threonine-protein phosphatase 2A activator